MKTKLKNIPIATIIIALATTVFGSIDRVQARDPNVGTIDQPLNVASKTLWPSPNNIPVCWENPGNATEKGWVRKAISTTWETVSGVKFTGWGQCNSGSRGIRIQVADGQPHTKGLGNQLNGKSNGMVLNFTFGNWSTPCQDGGELPPGFEDPNRIASSTEREFCIKAIGVHEFGHALGIAHEQNRVDRVPCDKEPKGSNGDWTITPYDLKSVMNYCNPDWNGNGQLSDYDKIGINILYKKGNQPVQGTWMPGRNGSVPPGALKAGSDNGEDLYVCRITQPNVSGGVVNGKLHPRFGRCYIAYGKEQEFTTYEVLVGNNLRWVAFGGAVPLNAIVAGSERNGVPLYVCRARLGSGITPGKYHPVNKICYVPYGGKYSDNRYGDILVGPELK
jgi:Protein of unknown function (DUF3421)